MVEQSLLDLADELDSIASQIDTSNYHELCARGAQVARRVDASTADYIETLSLRGGTMSQQASIIARAQGAMRGAATATRIDGAAVSGTSSTNIVNVEASSNASASAVSIASVEPQFAEVLGDPELPQEARDLIEQARADLEDGDRPSALKRLAESTKLLAEFPKLALVANQLFDAVLG